jgi:hypothetical protein
VRRWLTRGILTAGLLVGGALVVETSDAAFVGHTTNPGNSFGAGVWVPMVVTSSTGVQSDYLNYVDVAKPVGVLNNDVLIAAVAIGFGNAGFTTPVGWTVVATKINGGNSLVVYHKVVTNAGAEPATYRFPNSAWEPGVGGILLVRGANTTTPIDGTPVTAGGTGTGPAAGSITTTGTNRLVLAIAASNGSGSFTPPAGMGEDYDRAGVGGDPATLGSASVSQSAAGATGAKTFTYSASSAWTTATVAVR